MKPWLLDTGPLIALLVGDDSQHEWAVERLKSAPPSVVTCDAVISETLFLLKREGYSPDDLFALIAAGFLRSSFDLQSQHTSIRKLMDRYHERPISFADACLVRMAELHVDSFVWTLDRDFTFYRMNHGGVIPLIAPWSAESR